MVQNHSKRVMDFITNMNEWPLTQKSVDQKVQIRDVEPWKFIGPSKMTFNSYQKRQNKEVSPSPLGYLEGDSVNVSYHQFRDRNKQLEIQRKMVYNQENNCQTILQKIQGQGQYYTARTGRLRATTNDKNKFSLHSTHLINDKEFYNTMLAKEYLPDMNEKFHFKSMDTVFNNLPTSIQKKQQHDLQLMKMQGKGGASLNEELIDPLDEEQKAAEVQQQLAKQQAEHNRKTRQSLVTCGYMQNKRQNVKQLFKGEGHNSCDQDHSIQEIYDTIITNKRRP